MNNISLLPKERISSYCVCCGGKDLKSSPAILMPFIAHRIFKWVPVVIDDSWGLKTIQNGYAYSVCNSMYCTNCEHLFLDIRFNDDELSKLYEGYRDKEYALLRDFYEPGYMLRNDGLNAGINYVPEIEQFLAPFINHPLTILDWGGDTGINTPFQNKNVQLEIYDINGIAPLINARKISKAEALTKKYRLIVCSNVLEHVPYPADLMEEMIQCMHKDSILYIEVPLEDIVLTQNIDLHLHKKHWHEHINFFTKKSIKALVENSGLRVIDLKVLHVKVNNKSAYVFQLACQLFCQ